MLSFGHHAAIAFTNSERLWLSVEDLQKILIKWLDQAIQNSSMDGGIIHVSWGATSSWWLLRRARIFSLELWSRVGGPCSGSERILIEQHRESSWETKRRHEAGRGCAEDNLRWWVISSRTISSSRINCSFRPPLSGILWQQGRKVN